MTDGVGGLWLTGEIQRAVAKEYNWPDSRAEEDALAKIDPSALRAYTGDYIFDGLFKFIIAQNEKKLYLQYGPFGDKPQELFAESENRFFLTNQAFVVDFQKEADGIG